MVTIHQITGNIKSGEVPVMPTHNLESTKDTRSFKKGDRATCFINKMTDGRFGVMSADFLNVTKHYEVFTEKELHESFKELG